MADNPYYRDPYLARIASNLAGIFVDKNPGQTLVAREHAGYYSRQSAKLDREAQGRSKIANAFRALKGGQITPEQFDAMTGDAVEADMKPGDISGMTLYRQSNTGQPDSVIARAFVGAGKGLHKGEGVSLEDRENIRSKDAANDKARSDSSAGIAAGAHLTAAREAEAGRMARRYDAPVDFAPGHGKAFSPGDTRRPTGVADGEVTVPVPAKPTADRFVESEDPDKPGVNVWRQATDGLPGKAIRPGADHYVKTIDPATGKTVYARPREGLEAPATADKFVQSTDENGKPVWRQARDGLPAPAPKPTQPRDISPKETQDIELYALNDLGAVETDDAGRPRSIHPEFRKMYGAKLEGAKMAAAAAYQATGDAAQGAKAYRDYLGIAPGSTFKPAGTPLIGSGPAAMQPPAGAPAAPPAAAPPPIAGLPPAAAAQLKEGVQTKFANGQVWTKQNGVPVQVQ